MYLIMAKLKSESQKYVELKEEDYLLLVENTIKMEALKIAGIEKMPIYKAMEHILQHQHIDLMVKPVSRKYSWYRQLDNIILPITPILIYVSIKTK